MRLLIACGFLLIAVAAQSILALHAAPGSPRPDLALVVVLAWAMLRGPNDGAAVGFLGGILVDSAGAGPFGVNAAVMGVLGYATGLGETNLYRGNIAFFLGAAALATAGYHLLGYLVVQAMGIGLPPFTAVLSVAVPAAVLNAVLLVPIFLAVRRALRALDGWRALRV